MNKSNYMNSLRGALHGRAVENVDEIMADYEAHFYFGQQKGLSEEEISAKLGEPKTIALAFETNELVRERPSGAGGRNRLKEELVNFPKILGALGRLIVIAPFNMLMFFIPGIIVFAVIIAGWAMGVAVLTVGFALMVAVPQVTMDGWAIAAGMLGGLGTILFSLTIGLVMFVVSTRCLSLIVSFIKWNIRFVISDRLQKGGV